jgi:hypothetical protein
MPPADCKGRGAPGVHFAPLAGLARTRYPAPVNSKSGLMGIDKESDIAANLQIGPTSLGMVRLYIEGEGIELPLDFDPDEAEEIAEEIRAAAARARTIMEKGAKKNA